VAVPVEVDGDTFDEIVGRAKVPVFVDFGARWCWSSRISDPEVEDLAGKVQGRALVLKVNTETQQGLAKRYGIETIPHFVVFQNGAPILQRKGAARSFEMQRWIEEAAEPDDTPSALGATAK
jgi:thioredoxin 2